MRCGRSLWMGKNDDMPRTTNSWNGRKEQRWGLVHLAKVKVCCCCCFLNHSVDANMLHNRSMWRFASSCSFGTRIPSPLLLFYGTVVTDLRNYMQGTFQMRDYCCIYLKWKCIKPKIVAQKVVFILICRARKIPNLIIPVTLLVPLTSS